MRLYIKTIKNEEIKMTKILLGLTVTATMHLSLNADVSMNSPIVLEHPIVRPLINPERPMRPKPIVRLSYYAGSIIVHI